MAADKEKPVHPRPNYRWKEGGFGGGKFWCLDTKYGVKYMCKTCGKKQLGINFSGEHMHWKECPHYNWKVEVKKAVKRIEREQQRGLFQD